MKVSEWRSICQKSNPDYFEESFLKRKFRYISIYFTIALVKLKYSPNNVTLLSLLFGLAAAYSFYNSFLFIGCLNLFVSIILDFSDGEVSRYSKSESLEGQYFDFNLHFILQPAIFFSICTSIYHFNSDRTVLLFGFLSTIGSILLPIARTYSKYIVYWLNHNKIKKVGLNEDKDKNPLYKNLNAFKVHILKCVSNFLKIWDFPDLLVTLIVVNLLDLLFGAHLFREYIIYFFGTTYTILVFFFLFINIKYKTLTRRINN